MKFPARYPDPNPIENLLVILARRFSVLGFSSVAKGTLSDTFEPVGVLYSKKHSNIRDFNEIACHSISREARWVDTLLGCTKLLLAWSKHRKIVNFPIISGGRFPRDEYCSPGLHKYV